MSTEFILGTIISVLLGWWGIWHAKKTKDFIEISIVGETFISLVSTFNERFNSLKFDFKELPAATNIFYYQYSLINTGTKDIDNARIFEPLEMIFPGDCRILEYKTKKSSEKIHLTVIPENNKLITRWDLLKPYENITVDLLLESKTICSQNEFEKETKVTHRITDLKKVEILRSSGSEKATFRKIYLENIASDIGVLAMVVIFIWISIDNGKLHKTPSIEVTHQIVSKSSKKPITIVNNDSKTVMLTQGSSTLQLPIDSLGNAIALEPKIEITYKPLSAVLVPIAIAILFLIAFLRSVKDTIFEVKRAKILRQLKE